MTHIDDGPIFSADEPRAPARGNATTLPDVAAVLAEARGRSPDEAAELVGRSFAPG